MLLEVFVNKAGAVESVRLDQTSGFDILDKAAIKRVKKWLFYPGSKGDELIEMWVKIPIRFQLK